MIPSKTTLICCFITIAILSGLYLMEVGLYSEARIFGSATNFRALQVSDEAANFKSVKTPSPEILSHLSAHERLLESETDPLPYSSSCTEQVFLLIVIASSPDGFNRRNAIRGTWASGKIPNVFSDNKTVNGDLARKRIIKTAFLIGKTDNKEVSKMVLKEAKLFRDIVFGTFLENYRNLTMKTRLGLKWAVYHCQSQYILKTDDDVFINTIPLIEWLKTQDRAKLYSGWCNFDSPVIRDTNNKWYVSTEDYSESHYPGYCLGGGYIMSHDVAERILAISYGRKLFPMEDLYIGLLIKDLRDVVPKDNKQSFNLVFDDVKGCHYNKLYLAHPVEPSKQLAMFLLSNLAQETC